MVKVRDEGQYPAPDGHLGALSLLHVPTCEQGPGPALTGDGELKGSMFHLMCQDIYMAWQISHRTFGVSALPGQHPEVVENPRVSPVAVGNCVQAGILWIEQGLCWL